MTLTTYEVAELKGCSPRYIQTLVKEGKIQADLSENALNNRKEYLIPVSVLDNKTQIKYYRKFRPNEELPEELRPVPKLKPKQSPPKTDKPKKRIDEYTDDERKQIAMWKKIIKQWLPLRDTGVKKNEIDKLYIDKIKREHPDVNISQRTLYRKYNANL